MYNKRNTMSTLKEKNNFTPQPSQSVEQKTLLEQQLEELIKVGVGGKFKSNEDYTKRIQEELAFEEGMIRGGIKRYNDLIDDAKLGNQESTTLYGIVFQQKYITKLSELINKDVVNMMKGEAGNRQIALKLVCQCLPKSAFNNEIFIQNNQNIWDVVSLIVLKNVIDGISTDTTLNKLAIKIGTALMLEARITAFKDVEKTEYNKIAKKLEGKNIPQNANRYQYKRNVWVYCMNKNKLQFDDWGKEGRLHLGCKMIYFCEFLGLVKHQNRKVSKKKTITYVEATPKIIEEIKNFNIKNEALFPTYLPMLMPPRDWENPFVGGYYGKKHNYKNEPEEVIKTIKENK